VFCFTSNFEGFPNAVLEAMSAALPVVCTEFGGAAELLTDSRVGYLVPKEDDVAMAEHVLRLLDTPPLRASVGTAAQAMVNKRHEWATLVRTMEEFYEKKLAQAGLAERIAAPMCPAGKMPSPEHTTLGERT
jgi:glycosyltransferase involved in cell wall biosynthesis